jgi:hypothetical protein
MKIFNWFIILVVAAAIVAAFFVVGSPQTQRERNFDAQRVGDLQNIQSQIGNYYQAKRTVPNTLNDLNDAFRGVVVPKDPETGKDYEYTKINATSFQLCATFDLAATGNGSGKISAPMSIPYYGPMQTWDHVAGRVCFNRTIDQAYFPPATK